MLYIFGVIIILLFILGISAALLQTFFAKVPCIKGKHVLITGGSSGIGKWCAIEAVKRGANVTIFARDTVRLEKAKEEIKPYFNDARSQKINSASVDITGDYNNVERAVHQAVEELGPVCVLINCAGFAIASKLEDLSIEDIKRLMEVNYYGSCFVTRAALPSMKSQKAGRIVFTSSQAGLVGVYGYSAYSAAKFALRGFAEVLRSEVKPFNISVTLALPPDTDTPGFLEEEKTKPIETRMISQTAGLFSPEVVAKNIVIDSLENKFFSAIGMDGKIMSIVCAGMSPVSSLLELAMQVIVMGPLRIIAAFYLHKFDNIIAKCYRETQEKPIE